MSFKSKEILLEEIKELFDQLNSGTFNAEKMNQLVENTQELYERSIILRHQADALFATNEEVVYEEDVFSAEEEGVMEEVIIEEMEEEMAADEVTEEPVVEMETTPEEETFSVSEKADDFSFDLFGSETVMEEEPTIEATPIVEEVISSTAEIENDAMAEVSSTHFPQGSQIQTTQPVAEEYGSQEETIVATPQPVVQPTVNGGASTFFSGYESIKTNPNAMMVSPRIEQLATCFSLNEKLFYIRELFNGSSNDFNQVVNQIDQLASFEDAKNQLNPIAEQNRWNLGAQVTVDFINKVERRFF